jgi:HEAT repeat protein
VIQASLHQLTSADPGVRAAACLALGRLRTSTSVGPLVRLLQQDGDPAVRDSAARGLGLIADPAALTALEQAAQSDGDRDVRHSAAFAVEVIRAHHPHP